MNRYERAFERLADRGVADGSEVLIESLAGHQSISMAQTPRPRKPRSGLVFGTTTALAVIAVGMVLWSGRSDSDVAENGSIVWTSVDALDVQYGPGGFVQVPFGGSDVILFSESGVDWVSVSLIQDGSLVTFQRLIHSDDRWLLFATDSRSRPRAWVSDNGRVWTSVELPEEMVTVELSVAGGDAFLVHNRPSIRFDRDLNEFWRSTNGTTWLRTETVGLPVHSGFVIGGGPNGFVAVPSGGYRPVDHSYVSPDGASWTSAPLNIPANWTDWWFGAIESVGGDRWLMFGGIVFLDDTTTFTAVLGSDDGRSWELLEVPIYPDGWNSRTYSVQQDGIYVAVEVNGETRVSVTRDGISWVDLGSVPGPVAGIAVADGRGVYFRDLFPVDPVETTATINTEEPAVEQTAVATTAVPGEPLIQEGLDLQAEILADGQVSLVEYLRSLEAMIACLADHGVEAELSGGISVGSHGVTFINGYSESAERLCYYSHQADVDRFVESEG